MGYLLLLYESGTLTGSLNITGCVEQPESGLRITRAAVVETSERDRLVQGRHLPGQVKILVTHQIVWIT